MALKYSYCVVFLTMKSGDVDKHVKYNTHSVPRETIEKMKRNFKNDPTPYYFKWAVPFHEGNRLKRVIKLLLGNCLTNDPNLQHFLKELETDISSLFTTYHTRNASSNQYHVTAAFTHPSKVDKRKADVYTKSPLVQQSLGVPGLISVIGLILTKNCIAARVLLDEQQKKIWGRNDSTCSSDISPIAFESAGTLDEDSLGISMKNMNLSEKGAGNEKYEFPTESIQPYHGLGCTAHITLGTRGKNKPVVAKETIQKVVQLEINASPTSQILTPRNLTVRCYGADIWVIYFQRPCVVQTLFCGHYDPAKDF